MFLDNILYVSYSILQRHWGVYLNVADASASTVYNI